MANNKIIVEVIGDTTNLARNLKGAEAQINRFSTKATAGTGGIAQLTKQEFAAAQATGVFGKELGHASGALDAFHLKAKRAQSVGLFKIAGVGVGAGVAIFAATQAIGELGNALRVEGDEAFTTEGRFRNLGAELLHGNLIGGIRALGREDLSLSLDHISKSADVTSAALREFAVRADDASEATHRTTGVLVAGGRGFGVAAEQANLFSDAMAKDAATARSLAAAMDIAAIAVDGVAAAINRAGSEAAAFGERGGDFGRGVGGVEKGNADLFARGAGTSSTDSTNTQATLAATARARAQATKSLQDDLRVAKQVQAAAIKTQKNQKDIVEGRAERARVVAEATAEVARIEQQIADIQARAAKSAAAAAAAAAKRAAAEAARLKALRIAREKAAEEARRAKIQSSQFKALGFAADGGEFVPTIGNLRTQLGSLTDRIANSGVNISSKLKSQLEGARKVLSGEFGKATAESRARIKELFDTIRGEFDKGSKGPLTKTTGLNTRKIVEGLGLSPDEVRALRGRLSGFNSEGRALAGGRTSTNGGFVGGRGPVVESHITLNLDGHTLTKVVSRGQDKKKVRNPSQRRGQNRGK